MLILFLFTDQWKTDCHTRVVESMVANSCLRLFALTPACNCAKSRFLSLWRGIGRSPLIDGSTYLDCLRISRLHASVHVCFLFLPHHIQFRQDTIIYWQVLALVFFRCYLRWVKTIFHHSRQLTGFSFHTVSLSLKEREGQKMVVSLLVVSVTISPIHTE